MIDEILTEKTNTEKRIAKAIRVEFLVMLIFCESVD